MCSGKLWEREDAYTAVMRKPAQDEIPCINPFNCFTGDIVSWFNWEVLWDRSSTILLKLCWEQWLLLFTVSYEFKQSRICAFPAVLSVLVWGEGFAPRAHKPSVTVKAAALCRPLWPAPREQHFPFYFFFTRASELSSPRTQHLLLLFHRRENIDSRTTVGYPIFSRAITNSWPYEYSLPQQN